MMAADYEHSARPCRFFLDELLGLAIRRNWCGLKRAALYEWTYRYGMEYPMKGSDANDGTQSESAAADA